jgi:hypothetical protein
VSFSRTKTSLFDGTDESAPMTPEEEAALQAKLDAVEEEKRRARLDPGPSWREWFLFDASRWWLGLVLFIADSWLIAFWLPSRDLLGLVPSLAIAIYAEYVLAQYLWHRPSARPTRRSGGFRPTWVHPFPYGRWTPEGVEARSGKVPVVPEGAPDPKEFL